MSKQTRAPFWLVRFAKFFLTLAKNKLAFVGLILLFLFVFTALAAPLITPYQPAGDEVSAAFNPPAWITLVKGPIGYSQNIAFSGLSLSTNGSGVNVTPSRQTASSIDLKVISQSQAGIIQLTEKLSYPYQGSPKRISDQGLGVQITNPNNATLNVVVYVERVGEQKFKPLWPLTPVNSSETVFPVVPIDSYQNKLNSYLNLSSSFTAADYIFAPRPAVYLYTMQIAVPSGFTGDVYVKNFDLALSGNTWGIFGTDSAGSDVFTQLVYGARLSLTVGLVATAIGIGVGLLIGLMAGYLGKVVDEVLMRFTDMLLVIPSLPLLIVLVATLGSSLVYIIFFLGFFGWMGFARVIRAQVLSLRERPFIEAAKASGAGTGYITVRHIFPNIVSLTYVSLALSVPAAIVGEAALSFLGLGDPTVTTWGSMLGNANSVGGTASNLAWWWIIPPGISIALLSLSFILIGYAMDEIFNPRLRRRR